MVYNMKLTLSQSLIPVSLQASTTFFNPLSLLFPFNDHAYQYT